MIFKSRSLNYFVFYRKENNDFLVLGVLYPDEIFRTLPIKTYYKGSPHELELATLQEAHKIKIYISGNGL